MEYPEAMAFTHRTRRAPSLTDRAIVATVYRPEAALLDIAWTPTAPPLRAEQGDGERGDSSNDWMYYPLAI